MGVEKKGKERSDYEPTSWQGMKKCKKKMGMGHYWGLYKVAFLHLLLTKGTLLKTPRRFQ